MKVGIITQPLGINIGGILQNWALQKTVANMGHNPVTLNFYRPYKVSLKEVFRIWGRNVRTLLRRLYGRYDRFMTTSDGFPMAANIDFINNEIAVTERCTAYSPLDGAGAYIVGSDQVWRPRYNIGTLEDSFLRFISDSQCIRVAYAASFGTETWELDDTWTAECKKLLGRFDAVSVREKSGAELCRTYLDRDAAVVLDPTLLLRADDYHRLYRHMPASMPRHTASYFLDINTTKHKTAVKAARILGATDIDLHPRRTHVAEWLSAMASAEVVITDSFHGTVFAIIFHRKFAVLSNHRRGNSRLHSLLSQLGLENHLIANESHIDRLVALEPDWHDVECRLDGLRSISLQFLNDALK